MAQKLLRIAEVAARLDVRVERAYELAREGVLPVVRLGRQIRIEPERFEAFIERGGQGTTSGKARQPAVTPAE